MILKKINEIFGYALFGVGALKMILVILLLIQFATSLGAIVNGELDFFYNYTNLALMLGIAQFILAMGSVIMIIFNLTNQPEVIIGYLIGLGAILIEFFAPSFLTFISLSMECGMYMKAGSVIRQKNEIHKIEYRKPNRKTIKNTEWFYSYKTEATDDKEEKRKAKIEKELSEWKELLDSGEIDEVTYNEETNRLIEKEKRRMERKMQNQRKNEGITLVTLVITIVVLLIIASISITGGIKRNRQCSRKSRHSRTYYDTTCSI